MSELIVYQDGCPVAKIVAQGPKVELVQDSDFVTSKHLPISLHTPKILDPLSEIGIVNLPPFFANLLPEGLMQEAVLNQHRLPPDDLFAQLAVTGADAIGDITVRPPGSPPPQPQRLEGIDFDALLSASRGPRIDAIPGVQPKVSVGTLATAARPRTDRNSYILKVDNPRFPGIVANEAFFMSAAKESGLRVAETRLTGDHLLVTRFDRVYNRVEKRQRQIHQEDGLQILNEYTRYKYSPTYADLCKAMAPLIGSEGILNLIELYALSYLIVNGDLHAKNVSLNRTLGGNWTTTPCYDLISTLPYEDVIDKADEMALGLADPDRKTDFGYLEFAEFADRFGVERQSLDKRIAKLLRGVEVWTPGISQLPYSVGIRDKLRQEVTYRASLLR